MNPLKCLKAYKKSFDCRQRRTTEKLTTIEHMVSKNLKLVEYSPVPLEHLTDEALLQMARQRDSNLECLAYVKNPANAKLRRYNERLNQVMAQAL